MAKAQVATPARGGSTVTVGCKLPHGMILKLYNMVERPEPIMGGGVRLAKVAEPIPDAVVQLRGTAMPAGHPLPGGVGGYALTPGVPRDFWEAWLERNKDCDAVKNHMIIVQPTREDARAQAKEMGEVDSNQGPMDTEMVRRDGREVMADARVPRGRVTIAKGTVKDDE